MSLPAESTTETLGDDDEGFNASRSRTWELLTRNLRLLELDTRPDWPALAKDTFLIKNEVRSKTKARFKRAEWLLYHLCNIWSPSKSEEYLEPYFPPLEPLQSIKLRSNAFILLEELKRNGILPRGCPLRKSLLDDCVGHKFEELLCSFSTVVLQKQAQDAGYHLGPLSRLAVQRGIEEADAELVTISSLALQHSLLNILHQRRVFHQRYLDLQNEFQVRSEYFNLLSGCNSASLRSYEATIADSHAICDTLKRHLRSSCNTDSTWREIVLSGEFDADRDALIETDDFDELWSCFRSNQAPRLSIVDQRSMFDVLERSKNNQKHRLERWRKFQNTVSRRNGELVINRSPTTSPRKTPRPPLQSSPSKTNRRKLFDSQFSPLAARPRAQRASSLSKKQDVMVPVNGESDFGNALSASQRLGRVLFSRNPLLEETRGSELDIDESNHTADTSQQNEPANVQADGRISGMTESKDAPSTTVSTLAQRTRMSMFSAARTPLKQREIDSTFCVNPTPTQATEARAIDSVTEAISNVSLYERAQQSMSQLQRSSSTRQPARTASHRKSRSHQLTRKPAFPVNPFDEKPATQDSTNSERGASLHSEPDNDDTASGCGGQDNAVDDSNVFKPRSKLRRSPPRDPQTAV
ncbi:MAG: hypothetical protein Q9162_001486 [Coniocarpon cinnabarinum]